METIQKIETLERRAKIFAFEDLLALQEDAMFGDIDKMPLEHFFANGIYVRKITIPAGMILTGKIHKHEHPNFLMKGRVTVFTEQCGSEVHEAPKFMMSPPGTKRAIYAHTEVVWFTIHRTDSTDLGDIENEVIVGDYAELDSAQRKELL